MTLPAVNYSILLNAPLSLSSAAYPGLCVLPNTSGIFVAATAANYALLPSAPVVCLNSAGATSTAEALCLGLIPPTTFSLGAGLASVVVADPATGAAVRGTSAGLVVGSCDAQGTVTVFPATLLSSSVGFGTGDWTGFITSNILTNITGTGGVVAVACPTIQWGGTVALPGLTQAIRAAGAGAQMSIVSQASAVASGAAGGVLKLGGGAGDGAGVSGAVQLFTGGTQAAVIGLQAPDFLALSLSPPATGTIRLGNNPTIQANGTFLVQTNSGAATFGSTAGNSSIQFAPGSTVGVTDGAKTWLTITGAAASSLAWDESATSLALKQNIATTGTTGAPFTISAQAAKVASAAAGGLLKLQAGAGDGAGVAGRIQLFNGAAQSFNVDILGGGTLPCLVPGALATSFGNVAFMATATGAGTYMNTTTGQNHIQVNGTDQYTLDASALTCTPATIQWVQGTASPTISQLIATGANNGTPMAIVAQAAKAGAGGNGGALQLTGGAEDGAGLSGPVQLRLNGTTLVAVEAAEVVDGNRIVALARLAPITATQMPANTGDGVVYIANATTAPTVSPVSGAIVYGASGAITGKGTGGTLTGIIPAGVAGATSELPTWTLVTAIAGGGGTVTVGGTTPTAGQTIRIDAEIYGNNGVDGLMIATSCIVNRAGAISTFTTPWAGSTIGANNPWLLMNAQQGAFVGVGPTLSTAVWTIPAAQPILTITNNGAGNNDFRVRMRTVVLG